MPISWADKYKKTLGRLPQFDPKNLEYPLPMVAVPAGVRRRLWNAGAILDQGETSECVGYAGYGFLLGGPVINKKMPFKPHDLYKMAQANDEWPGDNYEGSSTLGLMKALKAKGYVSEYRWAYDAETLVAWILMKGPVLVGTTWYRDMFKPDHAGFIRPTGEEDGGHEWRVIGADRDKKCPDGTKGAVRMINSWGTSWGQGGRAWISFKDFNTLVSRELQGEAVVVTEIKVALMGGGDTLVA